MLPVNEVLIVAAVVVGVLLIVGGTMLARKPDTPATQTQTSALGQTSASKHTPAPWWTELLGPNAPEPTLAEQTEMLARLKLLDTSWARAMVSKAATSSDMVSGTSEASEVEPAR